MIDGKPVSLKKHKTNPPHLLFLQSSFIFDRHTFNGDGYVTYKSDVTW